MPIEDYLMDVMLIILSLFALDGLASWIEAHWRLSFYLTGVLQLLAFVTLMGSFRYTSGGLMHGLNFVDAAPTLANRFHNFIMGIASLSIILAVGSGMWLTYPRTIIDSVLETPLGLAGLFEFGIIILTILSLGLAMGSSASSNQAAWIWRWGSAISVGAFLFFSEGLLASIIEVGGDDALAQIAPLFFTYLPFRLLLTIRAPYSPAEFVTAVLAFAVFISRIV